MRERNASKDYYKQLSAMGTRVAAEAMQSDNLQDTMKDLGGLAHSFKSMMKQGKKHQPEDDNLDDPYAQFQKRKNRLAKESTQDKDIEERDTKKNAIPRNQPLPKAKSAEKTKCVDEGTDMNKLRDAMILAEIVGKPVCKTRRARRT